MLYTYYASKSITSGIVNLNSNSVSLPWDSLDGPSSPVYHYEGWLFINNNPAGKNVIFQRANDFALALNNNALELYVSTTSGDIEVSSSSVTKGNPIMVITNNFPFQKWVYIVINVNNRIIEAYLNGKLVKTIQMSEQPLVNKTSNLSVASGKLNGYLTRFIRTINTLNPDEVWKSYLSGNGTGSVIGSLSKYNINMSILKGDQLQKELTLF